MLPFKVPDQYSFCLNNNELGSFYGKVTDEAAQSAQKQLIPISLSLAPTIRRSSCSGPSLQQRISNLCVGRASEHSQDPFSFAVLVGDLPDESQDNTQLQEWAVRSRLQVSGFQ